MHLTYSKSYKVHFRNISPFFLNRGNGCHVWDEDKNKYIDFICGLLPIIIGYNEKTINNAIISQLKKGITFSPKVLEQVIDGLTMLQKQIK